MAASKNAIKPAQKHVPVLVRGVVPIHALEHAGIVVGVVEIHVRVDVKQGLVRVIVINHAHLAAVAPGHALGLVLHALDAAARVLAHAVQHVMVERDNGSIVNLPIKYNNRNIILE